MASATQPGDEAYFGRTLGINNLRAHFGNLEKALRREFDDRDVTYFARKMQIVPNGPARMARWRKQLFVVLHSNAADVTSAFNLPSDRVVEFGTQMRL